MTFISKSVKVLKLYKLNQFFKRKSLKTKKRIVIYAN